MIVDRLGHPVTLFSVFVLVTSGEVFVVNSADIASSIRTYGILILDSPLDASVGRRDFLQVAHNEILRYVGVEVVR